MCVWVSVSGDALNVCYSATGSRCFWDLSLSFYVVDMTGRRTLDGVYIHCVHAGFS